MKRGQKAIHGWARTKLGFKQTQQQQQKLSLAGRQAMLGYDNTINDNSKCFGGDLTKEKKAYGSKEQNFPQQKNGGDVL